MGDGPRGAGGQRRHRAGRRPRRVHPHPRGEPRDPARQPGADDGRGTRRRNRGHPVAQPAAGRRFQVQPAARRTRRLRRHVGHRRAGQRADPRQHRGRAEGDLREGPCRRRFLRLPRHLRRRPAAGPRPRRDPRRGGPHRSRPSGRRERRLLGGDRRSAPPGPDSGQSAGRPDVALHDAGLGRQDPDGLLLTLRDGLAGGPQGRLRHRHGQRRRRGPPRHRDARRGPDESQPLPGRGDRAPLRWGTAGLAGPHAHRQDPASRAR